MDTVEGLVQSMRKRVSEVRNKMISNSDGGQLGGSPGDGGQCGGCPGDGNQCEGSPGD